MKIILVDDEPLLLENLKEILNSMDQFECVAEFTNPVHALDYIKSTYIDTAILDIEMPSMNGLDLADQIHKINPNINIIFLTSYSQYAISAFDVNAIGYVLKPVNSHEIHRILMKTMPQSNPLIPSTVSINTFDGFDVFINGQPLHFPRQKSKELLALLVDKRGATITNREGISYLWEDLPYDEKTQENYKKCAYVLKKTLKDANISYIINDSYNSLSINPSTFQCDYYDLLTGSLNAKKLYHGLYMPNYSWAEETNGLIYSLVEKK